jgi:zinc transporter ZupT
LLAGTALGLSTKPSTFFVLLIAILAHKWAAAFALSMQLSKVSISHRKRIILFLIFAVMTPLGIIFGEIIVDKLQHFPLLSIIFSALAAGTFLYLGTLHGLARSFMIKKCCNLNHFSFVIVGFVIMAIVAIWT